MESDSISTLSEKSLGKKKSLLDGYWNEKGDQKKLLRKYQKLKRSIDHLSKPTWEALRTENLGDVLTNLIETSKTPYSSDINQYSHEIIFRLALSGIAPLATGNKEFIKAHADYLAIRYPAALLLALAILNGLDEAQKFIDFVNTTFKGTDLGQTCERVERILRSYSTVPNCAIADNINRHAGFIIDNMDKQNVEIYDDVSLFIGFFPWLYHGMQPQFENNEWRIRSLPSIDARFASMSKSLFASLASQNHLIKSFAAHHAEFKVDNNSKDSQQSKLTYLMTCLRTIELFSAEDASKGKDKALDVPESLKMELQKAFEPGRWQARAYYTSTRGPLLLSSFRSFLGQESTSMLVRFISINLGRWDAIKRRSLADYCMIRTVFLGMASCGVERLAGKDEQEGAMTIDEWKELVVGICIVLREEQSLHIPIKEAITDSSSTSSILKNFSKRRSISVSKHTPAPRGHVPKAPSIIITEPPAPSSPLSPTSTALLTPASALSISSSATLSVPISLETGASYADLASAIPESPEDAEERKETQCQMCTALLRVATLKTSMEVAKVCAGLIKEDEQRSNAVKEFVATMQKEGTRRELWGALTITTEEPEAEGGPTNAPEETQREDIPASSSGRTMEESAAPATV